MNMHDKLQLAASSVPVSVTSAAKYGLTLQEWVYAATLVWIAVQAGCFIYDRIKRLRKERNERQTGQGN